MHAPLHGDVKPELWRTRVSVYYDQELLVWFSSDRPVFSVKPPLYTS